MKTLLSLFFLLFTIKCFSQTYVVKSENDIIVITNDSLVMCNIEPFVTDSFPCYDTKIGQGMMYWIPLKSEANLRKKIGSIVL